MWSGKVKLKLILIVFFILAGFVVNIDYAELRGSRQGKVKINFDSFFAFIKYYYYSEGRLVLTGNH